MKCAILISKFFQNFEVLRNAKHFENFISGYNFIYVTIIEVILHYFLHSFSVNLLKENFVSLDFSEKTSVDHSNFINTSSTIQNILPLETRETKPKNSLNLSNKKN